MFKANDYELARLRNKTAMKAEHAKLIVDVFTFFNYGFMYGSVLLIGNMLLFHDIRIHLIALSMLGISIIGYIVGFIILKRL